MASGALKLKGKGKAKATVLRGFGGNRSRKGQRNPSHSADIKASLAVVAIGASAGGLDPIGRFLAAMPADSGLAFVVIRHLDPTSKGMLSELLAK